MVNKSQLSLVREAQYIGYHTIWDIYDCDFQKASYVESVKKILNEIVSDLQLGKVAENYKQFEPIGVTGFILLEESHISIHTWPERRFVALDVFSCRPFEVDRINTLIGAYFGTSKIRTSVINRGDFTELAM